jgi:hypothetical protein
MIVDVEDAGLRAFHRDRRIEQAAESDKQLTKGRRLQEMEGGFFVDTFMRSRAYLRAKRKV